MNFTQAKLLDLIATSKIERVAIVILDSLDTNIS